MGKWIEYAYKVAAKSPHPLHQLGAVVLRGSSVLDSAPNLHRRGRCAERRALKTRCDPNRYRGCSLLVVRANGGCSKPCAQCMQAIREAGIFTVYFTNKEGVLEEMRV